MDMIKYGFGEIEAAAADINSTSQRINEKHGRYHLKGKHEL